MTVANPLYQIWLRDRDFNRIALLDAFIKCTAIKRFNNIGTWNLEVPMSSPLAHYITPTTGIIITRDGETIFSGSGSTNYEKTRLQVSIAGEDDNALLRLPARPTPSYASPPYPDEYDVTTGIASTIMQNLVFRNMGNTAPVEYKIPQLLFPADPLIGSTVTARARFDPLITLLRGLAATPQAGGLGFEIIQSDVVNNTLIWRLYQPRDKHLQTVFSVELHTAKDYTHVHQIPPANWFVVAGGDDFGVNRTIVEGGDSQSITEVGRRIVQFYDARGVDNTGELEQKLAELIAGAITSDSVTVDVADLPSLRHGRDYDLGDYVTAVVDGVAYDRIIREIELDFTPGQGVQIRPLVADPNATNDTTEAQHLFSLQDRISNIERNYNVPDDSIIADMLHPTMKTYIGDLKPTLRPTSQIGWIACLGQSLSRTTYAGLFSIIGTSFGHGSSPGATFAAPDFKNRAPIGAGGDFSLLDSGGGSINFTHHHTHSHGGGTLTFHHTHPGPAHTHPGSHSHGIANHNHVTRITHNHAGVTGGSSGAVQRISGSTDTASVTHTHSIPTDNSDIASGPQSSGGSSTQDDNNVFAASYSTSNPVGDPTGITSWEGGTEEDDTDATASGNVYSPYVAVLWMVYTGVQS